MRKFAPTGIEDARTDSILSTESRAVSSTSGRPNPFATPVETPEGSVYGGISRARNSTTSGGQNYFRSRRIRKDDGHVPPVFKKDPKEKYLTIIPVTGLIVGLLITGAMIYLKIGTMKSHNYCPILDDDFSTGMLNPAVWTKEVEVGGYG